VRIFTFFAAWMLGMTLALAQAPNPVQWAAKVTSADVRAGEIASIELTATIAEPWHIYGLKKPPKEGPFATVIQVEPSPVVEAVSTPVEPKPITKFDQNFEMELDTHGGTAVFRIDVKLKPDATGTVTIPVKVGAQACNNNLCLRAKYDSIPVSLTIAPGEARAEKSSLASTTPAPPAESKPASPGGSDATIQKARSQGLLSFLAFAFGAGLLALLTPCVFPMIPITVSFFAKKTGEGDARETNLKGAAAYSLGIIASFTLIGLAVTALFGATGMQKLAANPWVNLALAALFIVLALSLFGRFELMLPSGLVNRFQSGTRQGGLAGPIFMGVTFSLTTFTCTVPVVGGLLILATQGDWLYPAAGMLAFSSAFALPFFFLALFPQWLAKLPKSGSWLATVKAFMGFLELAAALKFISNIDLVNQWGLITRPVFITIWVAIMTIAGVYLMGWMVFGHDAQKPVVGWVRRAFGVASFAAAIWLMNGLQGGSLGNLGSFLPPDPYPGKKAALKAGELDWHDTFELAQKEGKPIFIDFTGVTCTNCRQVEQQIFPHPLVETELKRFARAKLFTDRPQDEANAKLQEELTKSAALPTYAILKPGSKTVVAVLEGSQITPEQFANFLKSGFEKASQ